MNHLGLAEALARAERDREPIAPPSRTVRGLGVADAYDVQRINIARRVAAGARVIGHKVGLTSAAMQEMLGVAEPHFGHLLDDMLVADNASGAGVVLGDRRVPVRAGTRVTADIDVLGTVEVLFT